MVHIIDSYYVEISEMNFTLKRKSINNKGEDVFKSLSYYSDLQGALRGCVKQLAIDELKGKCMSLKQACVAIKEMHDRTDGLLESIINKIN